MILVSSKLRQDSELRVCVSQGIGKCAKHPYFTSIFWPKVKPQLRVKEYNSVSCWLVTHFFSNMY